MPSKKRQTIRANPLDEIEIASSQNKAPAEEVTQPKSPSNVVRKKKQTSDSEIISNVGSSSASSAEEIFDAIDIEVSFPKEGETLQSQNVPNGSSHAKLSAEDIFNDELGAGTAMIVVTPLIDVRKARANKNVLLWSWVSVPTALIPFVVVDVAITIGIQVKMIKDLCEIYGVPFRSENARAFISALVGGGVATIASSGLKNVILKSLPHVGTTIAFLAQPALGFSTTYALGQVFVNHLENDGGLHNFDAEKMRTSFREQLEKGKELFKKGRNKVSNVAG